MKVLFYAFVFLTLSFLFGCSAEKAEKEEPCINIDELSEADVGEVIGQELNKIFYDPEHFHRRTGDPEEYEVMDFESLEEEE
ncbi:MAG: hypothetical protein F4219_02020 [Gammaproteobacteria bacterium]|nr:hypothetical protein [Gammaproteobacteria bacterium]